MARPVTISSNSFYVGEQPTDPLVITIDSPDEADNDRDITGLVATLIGDELPACTLLVQYPIFGQLTLEFTEPFAQVGVFTVQVQLTSPDGDVDITSPFRLNVSELPSSVDATIVTPSEVEATTGVRVSYNDVVRGQGLVALAAGRDLGDPEWLASLSNSDLFWLQAAISYQATEFAILSTSAVTVPYAPGVQSMSTGDQSITFDTAQSSSSPSLVAAASLALRRLSWLQPARTLRAAPFLADTYQPNPWRTLYTAGT